MTNKSELYTIMLMHECRVRRNDATNHQKRRYEKEISLFQPLSLSLNYTTNVKRTVTTPYVHTYVLRAFCSTECDKIDELRNRIYITTRFVFLYTIFRIYISFGVTIHIHEIYS